MSETNQDFSVNDKDVDMQHWFAMHVYMNKVTACRDELMYINTQLTLDAKERSKLITPNLLGSQLDYYAPFTRIDHVNSRGKRVVTEKPVIPSLFFIRCTHSQVSAFEDWMGDRAFLYKHIQDGMVTPIAIPLREMQMFMMVSSGDQEGLDYFGADAYDWKKGERVRVIDGRFKGLEGEIKRINGTKRLIVAIEGVCAVATTYIPRCFLEKI